MRRLGRSYEIAVASLVIALAFAYAVVDGIVGSAVGGFRWPTKMILLLPPIMLIGAVAFVGARVKRRRAAAAVSLVPADDPRDVPLEILDGVPRLSSITPHRGVVYRPALGPSAVVATIFCAGWFVCWVLTLVWTEGRWSAERCYKRDPYFCSDHWGLAASLVIGMLMGGVVAFRGGGHRWRSRLWPARRTGLPEWGYTPPPPDMWGLVWGALVTSAFLFAGIWSAIVGATRYADDRTLVAVGFVLAAISAPAVLAALGRAGYVWTLRHESTMLMTRRHYPDPPTPSTPSTTERILETASRRVPRLLGKTVRGFDPDPWFDVVDTLARIPSVHTFTLASRVTVVVAGRRLAVLACAQWPPGRYKRHGEASVTRDGQPYHDSHRIMAEARKVLDWLSKNVPTHPVIHAFIVVTTEVGGVVKFDNDADKLQLIGAADAPAAIRSFLAEQQNADVDRRVALAVWLAGPNLAGTGF